jgi:hypothetical protein
MGKKVTRLKKSKRKTQGNFRITSTDFADKLRALLVPYTTLLLISFSALYVGTYYLRKPLDHFLLYNAEDPGYVASPMGDLPLLGVHRFGDFLQIVSYLRLDNPYSTSVAYPDMYGPATSFIFRFFLVFPLLVSLVLITIAIYSFLTTLLWRFLDGVNKYDRLLFIIFFLWFSRPLLLSLDRGNIQGLIVGLNMLFFFFALRNKNHLAELTLVLSTSIKFYPIIFVLWFIAQKNWKSTWRVLLGSFLAIVIPMLIVTRGDLVGGIRGLLKGAAMQSETPTSGSSASAWIIRVGELLKLVKLENVSSTNIHRIQFVITAMLLVIGIWIIVFVALKPTQKIILLLALSSLATPVSWGYNLIWVTFALALLMTSDDWKSTKRSIWHIRVEAAIPYLFAILLLPIPWNLQGGTRINVGVADLLLFPVIALVSVYWVQNINDH